MNNTTEWQMSESLGLNLLLAFSGGFQDAYTFIVRDGVFANAQTGNIVLMSVSLMQGEWTRGLVYLFPVLAFALGVFVTDNIGFYWKNSRLLHWRQGILLMEIIIMAAVGFLPGRLNSPADVLVSLACAMQVQSYRKVSGNPYASTMCIGNLRSGTAALSAWFRGRGNDSLKKAGYYFAVILVFALGAGIGGNMSIAFGERTIWGSCAVLAVCFLLMCVRGK